MVLCTPPAGTHNALPKLPLYASLLTGATSTVTVTGEAQTEKNGTYTVTASSVYAVTPGAEDRDGPVNVFHRCANNGFFPYYVTLPNYNNGYRGTTTTNVGGTFYAGETLTVTCPYAFVLAQYSFTGIDVGTAAPPYTQIASPLSWIVAGSNDGGKNYKRLDYQLVSSFENFFVLPTPRTAYSTYLVIFLSEVPWILPSSPLMGPLGIANWNLFAEGTVSSNSWYLFTLSRGATQVFQAFIEVNNDTNQLQGVFDVTDPTQTNLLTPVIPDFTYGSDNVFANGNFTFNGSTISRIPALQTQYGNPVQWFLAFFSPVFVPNPQIVSPYTSVSYQSADGVWHDITDSSGNYGTVFSFAFAPLQYGVPTAPTQLVATSAPNTTTATLTWSTPPEVPVILSYLVTMTPSYGGPVVQQTTTTNQAVFPSLSRLVQYSFSVTATNSLGTSPPSAILSGFTLTARPSPPTNVSVVLNAADATSIEASATVFWTPPANLYGSTLSSYTLQGYVDGVPQTDLYIETQSTTVTKTTVRYLFYNTTYSFVVIANSNYGSTSSALSNSVTPILPLLGPPTYVGVDVTPTSNTVVAHWIDPVQYGQAPITQYNITLYNLTNGTNTTFLV